MDMIPVFKPLIEHEEIKASTEALKLGWLGMGAYVGNFEKALKEYLNCEERLVAAVSTGHAALHLGLLIAGVGQDDEVITPSFNNIADFQAILATGSKPVFCDIDENTLCIDVDKAEQLITEKTKAIIIMDYDCLLCDYEKVEGMAKKYNLRIIHDAAHAFGSKYQNKMVGSFSDICMFSFDAVKTLTCIDGGALIVRTEEELKKIHEMRLIGMTQPSKVMYQNQRAWTYDVQQLGFRYHMANLHAAIGLAQLKKMEKIIESRREVCRYYNAELSNILGVRVPKTHFNDISPFLYYLRVEADKRDELRAFLKESGVDTGIHWQPGHTFSLFKDCRKGNLDITEQVSREILSLPLHSMMDLESSRRVVKGIKKFFNSESPHAF